MSSNKAKGTVAIGAWGGKGGRPWSFIEGTAIRITEIRISYNSNGVTSLTFTYEDNNGTIHQSPTYGGGAGTSKTVSFTQSGEYLTKIEGTTARICSEDTVVVQSLTFYTNQDDYGPYGKENGTKFTIPIKSAEVVGFYGHAGNYIDNIGFYAKPSK